MQPSRPDPIDVLGRLFRILYRSLPMYLAGADPWTHPGDEPAAKVLADVVADQQLYAGRIAEAILQKRGRVDNGDFPMEFTELNMLSFDYLLTEMARRQKLDIAAIERCVADLASDLELQVLAEEVLGNARGHLESLHEVVKHRSDDKLKLATS
ncbi:MAG TPA: hypothetical protein VG056_06345 [Pirellulales bacterium]|jgi:hypothetical protein|nr:hypothetical protein [Pirellulales bacterium]